jgi:hypothetical protein
MWIQEQAGVWVSGRLVAAGEVRKRGGIRCEFAMGRDGVCYNSS